jgi:hypothetical protein
MPEVKDFDAERHERHKAREALMGERVIMLGGRPFKYQGTVSYTVLEDISDTSEREGGDLIRALEDAITRLLEPGQEEAFLEVVRSVEDPWTFQDLNDLCTWLTEAQVGRPLGQPSSSPPGDETTSTASTDSSSSKPAVASAA